MDKRYDTLLQVIDLEVSYHKRQVIFGISFFLEQGEVVALVGPNGAGKTTTLNTIQGLLHPQRGKVYFDGKDISHRKASENVKDGVSLVPQGGRVFPDLSVFENLQLGGYLVDPSTMDRQVEYVYDLFPILRGRRFQRANSLSGGERQMLAIGRALMLTPKLLLLDEPSAGLAPLLVRELMKTVLEIRQRMDTSVLIVEQNVREAFSVAQKAYVLRVGKIVLEDHHPVALLEDERLRKSYLS